MHIFSIMYFKLAGCIFLEFLLCLSPLSVICSAKPYQILQDIFPFLKTEIRIKKCSETLSHHDVFGRVVFSLIGALHSLGIKNLFTLLEKLDSEEIVLVLFVYDDLLALDCRNNFVVYINLWWQY